jgi:hypothetical protein
MDSLKLPTDNLYKFLAIGGLLAVVTAIYLWHQIDREDLEKVDKLEREVATILNDFHRKFSSPQMEGTDVDMSKYLPLGATLEWGIWNAYDDMSRRTIIDHLNMHDEQLHNLSWRPDKEHADIRRFWCQWFGLTDAQLTVLVSDAVSIKPSEDNLILKTMQEAADFKPKFGMSLRLCYQIWSTIDDLELIGKAAMWVIGAGIGAMIVGFLGWYFQVQRYQDRLLKLELAHALPQAGSGSK